MPPIQSAPRPKACPRCGGALYRGYDGDHCCMMCGEYLYPPAPRLAEVLTKLEPPRRGRPRKVRQTEVLPRLERPRRGRPRKIRQVA